MDNLKLRRLRELSRGSSQIAERSRATSAGEESEPLGPVGPVERGKSELAGNVMLPGVTPDSVQADSMGLNSAFPVLFMPANEVEKHRKRHTDPYSLLFGGGAGSGGTGGVGIDGAGARGHGPRRGRADGHSSWRSGGAGTRGAGASRPPPSAEAGVGTAGHRLPRLEDTPPPKSVTVSVSGLEEEAWERAHTRQQQQRVRALHIPTAWEVQRDRNMEQMQSTYAQPVVSGGVESGAPMPSAGSARKKGDKGKWAARRGAGPGAAGSVGGRRRKQNQQAQQPLGAPTNPLLAVTVPPHAAGAGTGAGASADVGLDEAQQALDTLLDQAPARSMAMDKHQSGGSGGAPMMIPMAGVVQAPSLVLTDPQVNRKAAVRLQGQQAGGRKGKRSRARAGGDATTAKRHSKSMQHMGPEMGVVAEAALATPTDAELGDGAVGGAWGTATDNASAAEDGGLEESKVMVVGSASGSAAASSGGDGAGRFGQDLSVPLALRMFKQLRSTTSKRRKKKEFVAGNRDPPRTAGVQRSASIDPAHMQATVQAQTEKLDVDADAATRSARIEGFQVVMQLEEARNQLPLSFLAAHGDEHARASQRKALDVICRPMVRFQKKQQKRAVWRWMLFIMRQMEWVDQKLAARILLSVVAHHVQLCYFKRAYNATVLYERMRERQRLNDAAGMIGRCFRHFVARKYRRAMAQEMSIHAAVEATQKQKAIQSVLNFERIRNRIPQTLRARKARARADAIAPVRIQRFFRYLRKRRERMAELKLQAKARIIQRQLRVYLALPRERRFAIFVLVYWGRREWLPEKHLQGVTESEALIRVVSQLQRWYRTATGNFHMHILFAARKAAMEHDQMLRDMAFCIQRAYRAYRWRLSKIHARRQAKCKAIQRCWKAMTLREELRRRVEATRALKGAASVRLQRWAMHWMWIAHLVWRCSVRMFARQAIERRRNESASKGQRTFRAYLHRKRMRAAAAKARRLAMASARELWYWAGVTVQKNWRVQHNRLAYHVKSCAVTNLREWKRKRNHAARVIQWRWSHARERTWWKQFKNEYKSATRLQVMVKKFLFRREIYHRVVATRIKRNKAARVLQRMFRHIELREKLNRLFVRRREMLEFERLQNKCAHAITEYIRYHIARYHVPMREAGRLQAERHRRERRLLHIAERRRRWEHKRRVAAIRIQRHYRRWLWLREMDPRCAVWSRMWLEDTAIRKIQKFTRITLGRMRFDKMVVARLERYRLAQEKEAYHQASNVIQMAWRHRRDWDQLRWRFYHRKQMLDVYKLYHKQRKQAFEIRDQALQAKKEMEDALAKTVLTAWKLGCDVHGRNYYYNYVTGESTWKKPEGWKMPIVDQWIKNQDDRGNMYYFNQITGESRWLPPCYTCQENATKWCIGCNVAFCDRCFADTHEGDEDMEKHEWTGADLEKEPLEQGEEYCIECERRKVTRMCNVCLDMYCDDCFHAVHHVGALMDHGTTAFRRVQRSWKPIKPRTKNQQLYYLNGATGSTQFDKPPDLMTELELFYYNEFTAHREAAELLADKIKELNEEVERVRYQRDKVWFEMAMKAGEDDGGDSRPGSRQKGRKKSVAPGGAAAAAAEEESKKGGGLFSRNKDNKKKKKKKKGTEDVLANVDQSGGIMSRVRGSNPAYRREVLEPKRQNFEIKDKRANIDQLLQEAGIDINKTKLGARARLARQTGAGDGDDASVTTAGGTATVDGTATADDSGTVGGESTEGASVS